MIAPRKKELKFDTVGYWSEVKLDIIKDYASEYSKIISNQRIPLNHIYIDAFAGAGVHISKATGGFIKGSPLNALSVTPPFKEYHFIDLDSNKVDNLGRLVADRTNVSTYIGDCNSILLERIFPNAQFEQYKRALCLLDPYGIHLNWEVIQTAGKMKSIEIFLNFPIADMNRNVFWNNPKGVAESDIARMNSFWGDDSWKKVAYTTKRNLFGYMEKEPIKAVVEHFKERLKNVAEFNYVSDPLAMRNSNNATIYYLFFASQRPVAKKIVDHIFKKYNTYKGAR